MREDVPVQAPAMTAARAARLVVALSGAGVRCWVMGGWGVDALLGRQTRPHKDLDLLVHVADLPALHAYLRQTGFVRTLEWEENVFFERAGQAWASAFVEAHEEYGAVDVHVVDLAPDGSVVQLSNDPWPLPDGALTGSGRILGTPVACVTREAQHAMHTGYDLPAKHRDDLVLLG